MGGEKVGGEKMCMCGSDRVNYMYVSSLVMVCISDDVYTKECVF